MYFLQSGQYEVNEQVKLMEVQWNLHVHNWIDEGVIWVLNWDGRLVSAQCTYHSLLTPSMPYIMHHTSSLKLTLHKFISFFFPPLDLN